MLINTKINGLLIKGGYEVSEQLKNGDLYFIGNKKILLLFKREIESDNNYDEIGYINDKNIFIPEYVLEYTNIDNKNNDIKLLYFNKFLNNNFISFCSESNKESCHIYDENNSPIGKCFRINKTKIPTENKIQNLNYQDYSNNNNSLLDELERDIQKYVELFIQFHLFYEKMKIKINQSLINSKKEKYYIIKKKWTNKFMEYFEYNKFEGYIKIGNINEIINKYKENKNDSEFIVEIMKLLPKEYKKNIKNKIKEKREFDKLKVMDYYCLKLKIKQ